MCAECDWHPSSRAGKEPLLFPSSSQSPSSLQNSQNQHFAGELLSSGNTSALFSLMAHVGKCRCCLGTRSDARDGLGRREGEREAKPLLLIPEPWAGQAPPHCLSFNWQ